MPDHVDTSEDEAALADLLTQAVVLAERLLEAKHAMAMHSPMLGGIFANPVSATLRALLTAREEFVLVAQGAYNDRERNGYANEFYVRGADGTTVDGQSFPTLVRVSKEANREATDAAR